MEPLLLILDLDETLVFAEESPLAREADFTAVSYFVYKRPHLDRFLEEVLARYRVAIWTASGSGYAEPVLEQIMPQGASLEFVWCSERCTSRFDHETRGRYTVKNLRKVRRKGFDLRRVLAVDDTPQKYERSYGNLIEVRPFEGDPRDEELPLLLDYLRLIEDAPNFRTFEKRGWRRRVRRRSS